MIEFLMIVLMLFSSQIGAKIRQWIDGDVEGIGALFFVFVYGGLAAWAGYLLVYVVK